MWTRVSRINVFVTFIHVEFVVVNLMYKKVWIKALYFLQCLSYFAWFVFYPSSIYGTMSFKTHDVISVRPHVRRSPGWGGGGGWGGKLDAGCSLSDESLNRRPVVSPTLLTVSHGEGVSTSPADMSYCRQEGNLQLGFVSFIYCNLILWRRNVTEWAVMLG